MPRSRSLRSQITASVLAATTHSAYLSRRIGAEIPIIFSYVSRKLSSRIAAVFTVSAGLLLPAFLAGCTGGQTPRPMSLATGGVPKLGRQGIAKYHCGECHTIPGISGAHGVFGPPLVAIGRRTYIAGEFPNAPGTLIQWIMHASSMKPGTAMPNLNVPEQQARDIAAYLYTLQ